MRGINVMRRHPKDPRPPAGAGDGEAEKVFPRRPWRLAMAAAALVLGMVAATAGMRPALAADNPYQRGPEPTLASVSANRGTFATEQVSVPTGSGFASGQIYYPTDTSQGTFGAVAIVPGYNGTFSRNHAWMGPWLASFGFVVIGIETTSGTDYDTARGTQLLAALDYLTQSSSVRDRVDPNRLAVMGHSMGGGGALVAATQRSSLKAAVGFAPFKPSGNLANDQVPTMILGGENDTTVTPSYLDTLYPSMPANIESAYVQMAGYGHELSMISDANVMRLVIPWLKIFVDNDTRYTQFLCPLADSAGVSKYQNTCPLVPSGGSTTTPVTAYIAGGR